MFMQSRKAYSLLRNKRAFAWLLVAAVVFILDWYSKAWASESLGMRQPQAVLPWLNLVLAHNTGAAFSLLADAGGWQRWLFTVLALVVTVILLIWLLRLEKGQWPTGLALGLIIGGALGNVIDRLRFGYVIDFIDIHYAGWHWPAFNVADSAITCGIIILFIEAARESKSRGKRKHEVSD